MKAVSAKEIQKLDRLAIDHYGIPSIVLMENAGRETAEIIIKKMHRKNNPRVCILCGTGNNGGDGFVIARYLLNAGIQTKIFLIGKPSDLKADAAINYRILEKLGYSVITINREDRTFTSAVSKADIVVDAIFGVGLNRRIESPLKEIIESIKTRAAHVMSVDVPSGLEATTGKVLGTCIRARETVTFTFPKIGFYKNAGPAHVGRISVVDIGIPGKLLLR